MAVTEFEKLLSQLTATLTQTSTSGDGSLVWNDAAVTDGEDLLIAAEDLSERQRAQHAVGWLYWYRYQLHANEIDNADLHRSLALLRNVHRAKPHVVPPEVREAFGMFPDDDRAALYIDRKRLNETAIDTMHRFENTGERLALDNATRIFQTLTDLVPPGHPDRPAYLNNLGNALHNHYRITQDQTVLDRAVDTIRAAVLNTPAGHHDEASRHNNLGNVLSQRFTAAGHQGDLHSAIEAYRIAVRLTSHGDPARPGRLTNLGSALERRGDLDMAVDLHAQAAAEAHAEDPRFPVLVHNFGSALLRRYRRDRDKDDLWQAIHHLWRAVESTTQHHLHFGEFAQTLMSALQENFLITGDTEQLRRALAVGRRSAEELSPDRHDLAVRLNNYFVILYQLYQRTGHGLALDEAITVLRAAITASPADYEHKPVFQGNLSAALYNRYVRTGDEGALLEAIDVIRDAIRSPMAEPARTAGHLSHLSGTLLALFRSAGDLRIADEAVVSAQKSVDLAEDGHPAQAILYNSLSRALYARYSVTHRNNDLAQAIAAGRAAMRHTSSTDSSGIIFAVNLASLLRDAHHAGQDESTLAELITLCTDAAQSVIGAPVWRIRAARLGALALTEAGDLGGALANYELAVGLLRQVAGRDLYRYDQEYGLTLTDGLATEAAAIALSAGAVDRSVAILEQGRTQMLSQLLDTRATLRELNKVAPLVADRLEAIHASLTEEAFPNANWTGSLDGGFRRGNYGS